jgi:hypothetical protein
MAKFKLKPSCLLENLEGQQASLLDTASDIEAAMLDYRTERVTSDVPVSETSETFPYRRVGDKVLLHEIFAPLFLEGIPLMERSEADRLLSHDIGYNSKSRMPVRIHRNNDGTVKRIVGYDQTKKAYLIDVGTADAIELGENDEI